MMDVSSVVRAWLSGRRILAALVALWISLLLGASVLWPATRSPDERAHIEMAMIYSVHPFHFYGPSQLPETKAYVGMTTFQSNARWSDIPLPSRGSRPTLDQLGGTALVPETAQDPPDQMVEHPPLYYWLEALVLRIPGVSDLGWDLQIWLMRLLSVMIMVPVPLFAWATTRRLLRARQGSHLNCRSVEQVALVAAAVPLTLPNLIRDGAAVTNDSLLIGATSAALYLLVRVATGDRSRRTAALVALFVAVALWTKGFALVLVPLVLAAYVIGSGPHSRGRFSVRRWLLSVRRSLRDSWRPLGIAAIGVAVGLSWWVRNVIDFGAVQPSGYDRATLITALGPPDNKGTLLHFLPRFVDEFVSSLWGANSLTSVGPFIDYGWPILVFTGIVFALWCSKRSREFWRAMLLLSTIILPVLVTAEGSFVLNRQWSTRYQGVQGRYIYQTVVAIAALTTVGWHSIVRPRVWRVALPVVVVGAIVTNAAVWVLILRSWYQPATGLPAVRGLLVALHAVLRISPLPSAVTILFVGVLPTLCSLAAGVTVVRSALTQGAERHGSVALEAASEDASLSPTGTI